MTYPTIFERLRAMQPEESLSALIGEACDVGDELLLALSKIAGAEGCQPGHVAYLSKTTMSMIAERAIAKARRCPDGECTEKCAHGGAA